VEIRELVNILFVSVFFKPMVIFNTQDGIMPSPSHAHPRHAAGMFRLEPAQEIAYRRGRLISYHISTT
jgi:hypothetical protein